MNKRIGALVLGVIGGLIGLSGVIFGAMFDAFLLVATLAFIAGLIGSGLSYGYPYEGGWLMVLGAVIGFLASPVSGTSFGAIPLLVGGVIAIKSIETRQVEVDVALVPESDDPIQDKIGDVQKILKIAAGMFVLLVIGGLIAFIAGR